MNWDFIKIFKQYDTRFAAKNTAQKIHQQIWLMK